MTMWENYPCELERQFYDLELSGGEVICRVFPVSYYDHDARCRRLRDFYSHHYGLIGAAQIMRVRISDTHSYTNPT